MISISQSFTKMASSVEGVVPITFLYPSQVGDAIVVVIKWVGTNTIESVTDNLGNLYVQGPSATIESGVSAINLQIWYSYPIAAQAGVQIEIMVTFQ